MIGKLKGIIDSYGEDYVILDVSGVGYLVHCSARTLAGAAGAGRARDALDRDLCARGPDPAVRFHQRHRARMVPPAADRAGRRRQGRAVGARHAASPPNSRRAIAMRDKAMVARTPGVGPKVAERIVTELKDKAPAFADIDPAVVQLAGALDEKRAPQPVPMRSRRWSISATASRRPPPRSPPRRATRARAPTPRQLIRLGLKELAKMSTPPRRLVDPRAPRRRRRDGLAAPAAARREFIGQEQARANLSVFIEAARARKEALDHVLFVGPPGLGKTTLAQIVARELGVNFRATSGPVIAKAGDLAALLTNLEAARRAVHRRDPPAQSGGRGNPLSGDGGFPARSHHRRGTGGALGEDRSRAVHAGRRHHARGPAHQSAARPLRHSGAAQFLYRGGAGADRQPRRARARHWHDAPTAPTRSRGARAARRASPAGCCARVRDFAHVDGAKAIDRKVADRALGAGSRCRRPRRHGPALSHDHRRRTTAAGRSASRPSRRRCRSRATPSRTSSSRF